MFHEVNKGFATWRREQDTHTHQGEIVPVIAGIDTFFSAKKWFWFIYLGGFNLTSSDKSKNFKVTQR